MKIENKQVSGDGTEKYLFELSDGILIETVFMRNRYGNSVCVSSQAGCSMGCAFCASGLKKKIRNLTADEMAAQVFSASGGKKVTHVVVMGTGEPFDNYDEVIAFCDLISDEKKTKTAADLEAVAPRHITVSTCGIVPAIYKFATAPKKYNLAISLHAPADEIRNTLMPVNKKYPLDAVIKAAGDYTKATGRRVTFEYILLDGLNDSEECGRLLASLLAPDREGFYVNLIPYNAVEEFGFKGSGKDKSLRFYDVLMKNGIKATLRKERGADIDAACGQLRMSRLTL